MFLYRFIGDKDKPQYSVFSLSNVSLELIDDVNGLFVLDFIPGESIQSPEIKPVFRVGDYVSLKRGDSLPPESAIIKAVKQNGIVLTAEIEK